VDPSNTQQLVSPEAEKYWMPVDLYVGGAEHAVLHLLYARFWHKVLFDVGAVSTKEPFQKLVSQGMILGGLEYSVHVDEKGNIVPEGTPNAVSKRLNEEEVEAKSGGANASGYVLKSDPSVPVTARAHKMSKSRGNVVNPDDVVYGYGADSLRLYEMFMGPLRETKVWNSKGVEGVHRFLARVYRLIAGQADAPTSLTLTDEEPTKEQLKLLHACIKKVSEETEEMRFNTAIAAMMEFVNAAYKWDSCPRAVLKVGILYAFPPSHLPTPHPFSLALCSFPARRTSSCCSRPTPRTSPRRCGTCSTTARRTRTCAAWRTNPGPPSMSRSSSSPPSTSRSRSTARSAARSKSPRDAARTRPWSSPRPSPASASSSTARTSRRSSSCRTRSSTSSPNRRSFVTIFIFITAA